MENIIQEVEEEEGKTEEKTSNKPILRNSSEGSAAWLNRDKNGNAYISVRLPLGLGSVNLFPVGDKIEDALNQLADYLKED